MIIDDGKTMHFNAFFQCRDVIITLQTNVREMVDHDHDLPTFVSKRRHFLIKRHFLTF